MYSTSHDVLFAMMVALVVAVAAPAPGSAGIVPYERMAPLGRYLIADRQAEINLARSAAPSAISIDERLYLSRGTIVDVPVRLPRVLELENARANLLQPGGGAHRSALYAPTEMALSGLTKSQMLDRTKAAVTDKQLPTPGPGSMSYMMSKHGDLGGAVGPWLSHLMFYAPKADGAKDGASWGADLPASPVILDTSHRVVPEPETIFMVPVAHWSDGTPAPPR